MTDLEIVRKCAAKMYQDFVFSVVGDHVYIEPMESGKVILYDPLHDDEQAMALLLLLLNSGRRVVIENNAMKGILYGKKPIMCVDDKKIYSISESVQFRRAICECVTNLPEES